MKTKLLNVLTSTTMNKVMFLISVVVICIFVVVTYNKFYKESPYEKYLKDIISNEPQFDDYTIHIDEYEFKEVSMLSRDTLLSRYDKYNHEINVLSKQIKYLSFDKHDVEELGKKVMTEVTDDKLHSFYHIQARAVNVIGYKKNNFGYKYEFNKTYYVDELDNILFSVDSEYEYFKNYMRSVYKLLEIINEIKEYAK